MCREFESRMDLTRGLVGIFSCHNTAYFRFAGGDQLYINPCFSQGIEQSGRNVRLFHETCSDKTYLGAVGVGLNIARAQFELP